MLSRVADNLYWMSRYLERAEHTARLLNVNLTLMLDQSPALVGQRWDRVLKSLHITMPEEKMDDPFAVVNYLTFEPSNEFSILSCVQTARENARQVREQISTEMWEHLNRLYLQVQNTREEAQSGELWRQPHDFFTAVRDGAYMFQGVTDATMRHGEGFYFIEVGRFIERASKTAALLNVYLAEHAQVRAREEGNNSSDQQMVRATQGGEYLTWVSLLKSCTAFEAYCKVYSAEMRADRIAEFLLLDPEFPRSVRASADRIEHGLGIIAAATGKDREWQHDNYKRSENQPITRLSRLSGRLRSTLDFGQIDEMMSDGLPTYLKYVQHQCVQIHNTVYQVYIGYMVE